MCLFLFYRQSFQTVALKNNKPDINENLKCLLERIGLSPDTLNKKERKMVDKIVETYGGMETVAAELNRNSATFSNQSCHAKNKGNLKYFQVIILRFTRYSVK